MNWLSAFLRKDSIAFGAFLGTFTPLILILILHGIYDLFPSMPHFTGNPGNKLQLLSLSGNLLWMRYYFVSLRYELTGKALLAVTFILALLYFIFVK